MSISSVDQESIGRLSDLSDSRTSNAETVGSGKRYKNYTYDRLRTLNDQRVIRVMVLHGSGVEDAEVECELIPVVFKEKGGFTHPYEALSWCWGSAEPTAKIIIRKGKKDQKRLQRMVTPDLVAALKALRHQGKDRCLWIDQVCVDQDNPSEKNFQVAMMSEIYGQASKVCIWLGEGDKSSHTALEFIKREVLQLQNFDELCGSEQATEKWNDLLVLMQRPWFSRRWVVQEVALAHRTVLYCGRDKITWKKFAVAVELFVEVETASHRLSEVMKKDPRFYHVPGWFEYVSALGASLLVEATGKLFRNYEPYNPTESPDTSDDEYESDSSDSEDTSTHSSYSSEGRNSVGGIREKGLHSTKHSLGRPLLTLEYLVSTLSIFEVTVPHDAIYALLAIARDTTPLADDDKASHRRSLINTQEALEVFTEKKRYKVDYQQPFADVCKEFVAFCIEESKDPTRALDIICRPWAPNTETGRSSRINTQHKTSRHRKRHKRRTVREASPNPYDKTPFSSGEIPAPLDPTRLYAPQIPPIKVSSLQGAPQKSEAHSSDDVPLPSWIPSLSGAAFAMIPHAGADTLKMGRKNADALVGLPPSSQALERNYNAAETRGVDRKSLRFVKRPDMGHWSMYVKGFILDEITRTHASSQNGAIPSAWAKAGGWNDIQRSDPPNEFWRTLVADRGRDGKNPPVYYSRACRESFNKGAWETGSVDLSKLINNERCSVVAQFCRRVQAVIWNRCLIMTGLKRLGLSGQNVQREDLICILYGCSVPVILRRHKKRKKDVLREWENDLSALCKHITARYGQILRIRKENQQAKQKMHAAFYNWEQSMRKEYLKELMTEIAEKVRDPKKSQETREQERETIARKLATRRDFLAWLAQKRKMHHIPEEMIKIWDKHVFELRLRWGRRLKTLWKANKAPKVANKPLEMSGRTGTVTNRLDPGKGTTLDDGYVQRHKDWYLRPYKTGKKAKELEPSDRKQIDEKELEEPDWNRTDVESLLVQQKWSHYEFLGECYVHGMMDGEAMAYQNTKGISAQVFELR